jgi:hypothetical protein
MYLHAIYHLYLSLNPFNVYYMKSGLSRLVISNINKHFQHDQTLHPTTLQEVPFPPTIPATNMQIRKLSL